MVTFLHPWLLVLLPLPWIARWILPAHEERKPGVRVPFLDRLEDASGESASSGAVIQRRSLFQKALVATGWILIVVALARPQWVGEILSKTIPSRDLLLAVDLSGSMDAKDFEDESGATVERLTAVKQVLDDFIQRRDGDRVGLILFGNAAFVQTPFTEDLETCRILLEEAQVGMAGPKTMLGDAIGTAISVFSNSDLQERVLILLTDGNDSGSKMPPASAARVAADNGITIHTIVVGDPEAVGEEKIDEKALETIAQTTGGDFFRTSDRASLEGVYERIDAMDTRDAKVLTHRPTRDLYQWSLGLFAVLALVYHSFGATSTLVGGRR